MSDRIVGVSLTGMMDMVNKTGMSYEELGELLKEMREEFILRVNVTVKNWYSSLVANDYD